MKYDMNVYERMMTLQVLPAQSSLIVRRAMDKLIGDLSIGEEEAIELDFKIVSDQDDPNKNGYTWNEKGMDKKPFEIGDIGLKAIKTGLKKVDDEEKVTAGLMPVYDLFMPAETIEKEEG